MNYQIKKTAALFLIAGACLFSGCAKEGKPTDQGQLLTTEQIKNLSKDQTMNGKRVSVEGYGGFCSSFSITMGQKNNMEIYSDGICDGDKLIKAKVLLGGNLVALSGEKERNFVATTEKQVTDEGLTVSTDDYQEVKNGKLRFSGNIVYDGADIYLDNVSIHTIQ